MTTGPRTKKEYCEDMLLMCRYYGCKMNPEIDVPALWEHFEDNGFAGFLHYDLDIYGEQLQTPGDTSNEKRKQAIFTFYMDYIEHHAHREKHLGILEQCRKIEGPEQMTDFDLFTAGGYAGTGAKPRNEEILKKRESPFEIGNFVDVYEVD